jgi:hypothetical protein
MPAAASKITFLAFALLATAPIQTVLAQTNAFPRNAGKYTLAIYPARNPRNAFAWHTLTPDPITSNLVYMPTIIPKPTEMQINQTPILSDRDFTSYNVTNHSFTIKAHAARGLAVRLMPEYTDPRDDINLGWHDTSFVLFAGGVPIYVGMFSCQTSSQKYPVPTIYPDRRLPYIPRRSNRDVLFTIRGGLGSTNADPRADPRILAALKKLRLQ